MFTLKEVEALLSAGGPSKSRPSTVATWFDGNTWHTTPVPSGMASGSYRGKAGSIRRSAKGRTRRLPNGTRRYMIDYDSNVVAYKL